MRGLEPNHLLSIGLTLDSVVEGPSQNASPVCLSYLYFLLFKSSLLTSVRRVATNPQTNILCWTTHLS